MVHGFDRLDRITDRLTRQHHPGAAAKRAIVNLAMRVLRIVAELVGVNLNHTGVLGAPEDTRRHVRLYDLRE